MPETSGLKERNMSNNSEILPKTAVLLLNYNNWIDTLECLESVLRLDYPAFKVVCVENASTDASRERLQQWAEGRLGVWLPPDHPHRNRVFPPIADKTVRFVDAAEVEKDRKSDRSAEEAQVTVICSPENLGAAGGNNLAMKWAIRDQNIRYFWMINNDTVLDRQTLRNLVRFAAKNPLVGICGSRVMEYYQPEQIQLLGSKISRYSGKTYVLTSEKQLSRMNYIIGVSFLVSRECWEKSGPLREEYFIYNEETDFCFRARENGFRLAIAPDSVIYHKQGKGTDSLTRDYYVTRNMLYFGRIFYPRFKLLWLGFFWIQIVAPKIIRRQWKRLGMVFRARRDYRRGKMGRLT